MEDSTPTTKELISNGVCPLFVRNSAQFLTPELPCKQLLSSDLSKGSSGYTRSFDSCTQTPVLFNPTSKIFVTYEDAQSFKAKGAYAKQMGLAGVVGSFLLQ